MKTKKHLNLKIILPKKKVLKQKIRKKKSHLSAILVIHFLVEKEFSKDTLKLFMKERNPLFVFIVMQVLLKKVTSKDMFFQFMKV